MSPAGLLERRLRPSIWPTSGYANVIEIGRRGYFDLVQKLGLKRSKWHRKECPPRAWVSNIALLFIAVRLILFMRTKKLTHVHSHSCANSALIALFANRLANISYSLTLHGDLSDYGRQQNVKWRYAAFAISITQRLYDQVRRAVMS